MTGSRPAGNVELKALDQLFAQATRHASSVMCRWTEGLITLALDEVYQVPLEAACGESGFGEDPLVMVVIRVEGEVGGVMILSFEEGDGRDLAASLLGCSAQRQRGWTDMERSALVETGNILGCAYFNAITRLIDHKLVPSAPRLIRDYGASVLQEALLGQAMTGDQVVVCRTGFRRQGTNINCCALFVPTQPMRKAVENALRCGG